MNLNYCLPDLQHLDEVESDALVLFFFEDLRPLSGLTGLIDWRLNGQLSRLILAGRIQGSFLETLLFPCKQRLPFRVVIIIGLGSSRSMDRQHYQEVCRQIFHTLIKLNLERFTLEVPGWTHARLTARQLIEIWLEEYRIAFLGPKGRHLKPQITLVASREYRSHIDDTLSEFKQQLLHGNIEEPTEMEARR